MVITSSYNTYLRFKTILDLMEEANLSVSEISKKTDTPLSTAYKIIKDLQKENVIQMSKIRFTKGMRREKTYTKI